MPQKFTSCWKGVIGRRVHSLGKLRRRLGLI